MIKSISRKLLVALVFLASAFAVSVVILRFSHKNFITELEHKCAREFMRQNDDLLEEDLSNVERCAVISEDILITLIPLPGSRYRMDCLEDYDFSRQAEESACTIYFLEG